MEGGDDNENEWDKVEDTNPLKETRVDGNNHSSGHLEDDNGTGKLTMVHNKNAEETRTM